MRPMILTAVVATLSVGCAANQQAQRAETETEREAQTRNRKVTVIVRNPNDAAERQRLQEAEAKRAAAAARAEEERRRAARAAEDARRLRTEQALEAERARNAQLEAERAERELAASRQEQEALSAQLRQEREERLRSQTSLEREQRSRIEAERRARRALEQVASVREEARGLVVTLAAPVLFRFDEATLLPSARQRLDAIADALQASGSQTFTIEGHTDAAGSAPYNEDLSYRRAQAVRDHLVSRGVAPSQVRVFGFGEERPVANNASPEGRANNRRVEIVLPEYGVGGSGSSGMPGDEDEAPSSDVDRYRESGE